MSTRQLYRRLLAFLRPYYGRLGVAMLCYPEDLGMQKGLRSG